MTKDFYFKPDKVRIGTDFRDDKEQWYLQFVSKNRGVSFKINKKLKEKIIDSIINSMDDIICMDESWSDYFE
jgi:hypothetical protein